MQRETADLPGLEGIQHWMQAVIVHPGEIDGALASVEASSHLEVRRLPELIASSWSLAPEERVEIYRGMFPLRMIEALEADYPALRHHLGEGGFAGLALAYVEAHPSRSYTLNRLGDHLPRHLAGALGRVDAPFLADLARAELAMTEVFDAAEEAPLTEEAVQGIAAEHWAGARLRPVPAFRVLAFRHDVARHLDAASNGTPPPAPRRRASFLAFHRRDYSIRRRTLARPEFDALAALAAGAPVAEAIALGARGLRASEREARVFRWFRSWIAAGYFAGIEIG